MNHSPLAYADSLRIGSIDFVSPDEIKVLLDIEAPESLALNTGTPRPFPRINGYVLIPSDEGYLVGQVEWITIERSQYPKRKGMQDFGLVDLPYPLRKMSLNPLGTLTASGKNQEGEQQFRFRRGVEAFPSVGDQVLLPTQNQLVSIVESGENRRVKIGTSPLAGGADVKIDPNRLFGRHLAVLGNTGSGKSCSVAGLIRWSLESALGKCQTDKQPNARFIVLDPNGEYSRAFQDFKKARIFSVDAHDTTSNQLPLHVPLWFWNSAEWCAFTQASGKTQRPLLRRGLREIRSGRSGVGFGTSEEQVLSLRRYLTAKLVKIRSDIYRDSIKQEETKFGYYLSAIASDLAVKAEECDLLEDELTDLKESIEVVCSNARKSFIKNGEEIEYYRAFEEKQIQLLIDKIESILNNIGGVVYQDGPDEDCPLQFDGASFADHVQQLGIEENASQYVDFLVLRIRTLLSDTRMKSILGGNEDMQLDSWLTDYIGDNQAQGGTITIIDLSLVPSEVVHIITSVIARMTFEALQRYRRTHKAHKVLPTVLVMEEAHTFIRRYKEDSDSHDAAASCCQLFERIAREGRKFGLGLVLSSQRPSELSPTVLSQCNTFLLHRISNDRDQELVHKLVPDNLKGLLRDLPSLPSQNAILLGWASELPVMVRMNDLAKDKQPQSDDPDFWEVWTAEDERSVDWKQIADDWQQLARVPEPDTAPHQSDSTATPPEDEDEIPF